MKQKLYRGRRRVFHKRRKVPVKLLLWILAAAIIIPVSYFSARHWLADRPAQGTPVSSAPDTTEATEPEPTTTSSAAADTPSAPEKPVEATNWRGFYLPATALADTAALEQTLDQAAAAGFTAVVVELKDADGWLAYASETERSRQAQSVGANALSKEALQAALQTIKGKGLSVTALVYAFEDAVASRNLSGAKIAVEGNPSWTWYDDAVANGGRPWLNPYAEEAQQYILDILRELRSWGVTRVMLDGACFPAQTSSAYFGEQAQTVSKPDVLRAFIEKAEGVMGADGLVLAADGVAALGRNTAAYGDNPLTFGASTVAPSLFPADMGRTLKLGDVKVSDPDGHPYEAVQAALEHIQLRLRVEEEPPVILPVINGDGTVAEQRRAVLDVLGQEASYLLYQADGRYDFAALS